jgi:hypothetical protein
MPTVKVKPCDPTPKPCEKHFKNIGEMMRQSLGLPPPSVLHVDNGTPFGTPIHSHIVAIAGHLKRTAARSITLQVGSIVVEARNIAAVIIAAIILSINATAASPVPKPAQTITGSFLTCPKSGHDYTIAWHARTNGRQAGSARHDIGILYLQSGPTDKLVLNWDWPETTGIITYWEPESSRVIITDPDNYLAKKALWYTIKIWEAK